MKRRSFAILTIALLLVPIIMACAEQKNIRVNNRVSFSEVKPVTYHYIKKAALVLKKTATTPFRQQMENLYLDALAQEILKKTGSLVLETYQDQQLPDFLRSADPFATAESRTSVLSKARLQGYFALIEGRVINVSTEQKTTGIFWFRKVRYFLTVTLSVDVYDPVTSAKYASLVQSETVKIKSGQYDDFKRGGQNPIAELNEAIADLSETLGEEAADAVIENPWMTSIVQVQNGQVILGTGPASKLGKGDLLTVFEGRQKEQGSDGQIYTIPGYKVAEIKIAGFTGNAAFANLPSNADIQPGDIVVRVEQ